MTPQNLRRLLAKEEWSMGNLPRLINHILTKKNMVMVLVRPWIRSKYLHFRTHSKQKSLLDVQFGFFNLIIFENTLKPDWVRALLLAPSGCYIIQGTNECITFVT